jgi:high-affinity iron transporter
VVAALAWAAVTAGGAPDPTVRGLSTGTVVLGSALLVFREGLEATLILAAVTASMLGGNQGYRRPIAGGVALALAATVATWFIVVALISSVNAPELHVQAATGLLAVIVLLVVMNWFLHKVYWTGWISHHNRRRRRLQAAGDRSRHAVLAGFVLLGFTSVYREGFEVVLFLQNLRLQAGLGAVLEGVVLGAGLTALVGILTFVAHHHLPYRRMLVLTGALVGFVLVVMVGESAQELQLAGWIPTTSLPLPLPDWMGIWFAVFPTVETVAAQVLAVIVVIGSYLFAEHVQLRRPRSLGLTPARRAEASPPAA